MNPRLVYVLHSGNLYGTERMALATLEGLRADLSPILLSPPGPIMDEAAHRGIPSASFANPRELALRLRRELAAHKQLSFAATGVSHSLLYLALNLLYRRPGAHIHMVHGGTDERDSYGRKRLLNRTAVRFVAVSAFVRERLIAHGVRAERISVIENFLSPEDLAARPRRPAFVDDGVRRVLIVSRVDPIKRIDLLLDALDQTPELSEIGFQVLGTGWDLEQLRKRARASHPNLDLVGFSPSVPEELTKADLLLHLCPVEPFGLAILEAMAAGVPVLVPNRGGAGALIEDGVSGLHFRADDATDLARQLLELRQAEAARLNQLVAGADQQLATRFAAAPRIADYRQLLLGGCE
jgi:glycosyltransferase involved in cell wall biosynthesis